MATNRIAIRLALVVVLGLCVHAQETPAFRAVVEEGIASWYGADFDGLRAASGEIFDSGQLTAAHRTLPFGTKVRVRRMDSAQSIVVRINDRGPFVDSRIIDLSYAAAQRLGMTDPGLLRVALEVVELAPDVPAIQLFFAVQVGTFRNPDNARRTLALMQQKFGESSIQRAGEFWRVIVGSKGAQTDAETLAAAVRASDHAFGSAFVVAVGR
jgi:rare lipoprotein A